MKLFSANIEDLSTSLDHLQKALDLDRKSIRHASPHAEKPAALTSFGLRRHLQETKDYVTRVETLLHQAAGEARTH